MAKQDWGTKRQCPECGTRFYDLNRTPIVCVKCGTAFRPEPLLKPRRQRETEIRPRVGRAAPVKKPDPKAGNDKPDADEVPDAEKAKEEAKS